MNLLIRQARVLNPASNFDQVADIAIQNGRIAAIGAGLSPTEADQIVDADGLIACPGLIDPHVHLREPGQVAKEEIASGTRAAVAGGFTTVCCMPNTNPALDSPEMIEWALMKSKQSARCRVFPVAAATVGRAGEQITEIDLLSAAGAVAISDDGDVVENPRMMKHILQACHHAGLAFMQHCQESSLTVGAVMHDGAVSARLGLVGWPREAEEIIIERDIRLNRTVGCRYHVQHLSSGGSVEIIRRAKADGQFVSAEASPHHLTLTDEFCAGLDGQGYNTSGKMNPPLREQSDIDAIIAGVVDGTIEVLATDHAPHTAEEKGQPFETAPFGIIGLESALGIYAQALVEPGHIDWPHLIAMLTINPARLCNLDRASRKNDGLGEIFVGGAADITLIDPNLEWTFSMNDVAGKSHNSPFFGRSLRGRAVATIVHGKPQFTLNDLAASAAH